jgi:hypothetical protein
MLSHLARSKTLRFLAGAACAAVFGAAGALVAQPPEPLPPSAPVTAVVPTAAPAAPAPVAPAPVPRRPVPIAIAEVTLASSVLAALDADPMLKDTNVIVSVVDRGAVIGGPVTSEDVKKRVEAVVRGVPGVESVKNLCFVNTDADPLLRAMAERLKPGAKPAQPPPLPGVALSPSAPVGSLPPFAPLPMSDLLAGMTPPNKVVARSTDLPPVNLLGDPVAPSGAVPKVRVPPLTAPAPAAAPPPPLPTAPGALTGSPGAPADLRTAVRTVRGSDPRFARLTVDVKADGVLFVSGWCAATADVRDFATELRKLPGVVRIVVDPALVK